jgi:hypothetical protein
MGTLRVLNLGAIGSGGQNTESPAIDLPPQFLTEAINVVAEQGGRVAARKSAMLVTTTRGPVASNEPIQRLYRHNHADGSTTLVGGTSSCIFKGTTTLTNVQTVASAGTWQFATLNGKLFAAQAGQDLRWFNESTWAVTTISTPAQPRAIHAAYGRLWAISGSVLYWSDLLDGTNFTTGASGSLDLQKIHTQFRDTAVAVVSFNRQIVVLCRNSIYLLGLAADLNPNNTSQPIFLKDFVPNIGCIARDTAVSTGDDVLFLADDGVRALSRSMQEQQGPSPMTDMSALNHQAIISEVVKASANLDALAAAVWPNKALYLLFVPATKEVWVFDLANRIQNTSLPTMTVWRMGDRPLYHGAYWTDDSMYFGGTGGVYDYTRHDVVETFTMTLATGWLSLGDGSTLKHLKRALLNVRGGSGQRGTLKWYVDFDDARANSVQFSLSAAQPPAQFNANEFGSSSFSPGRTINDVYTAIGNSAKYVKFVIELPVNGFEAVVNNFQVFFTQGRVR